MNKRSWVVRITTCVKNGDLEEARRLYDIAPERPVSTGNSLINALGKARRVEDAKLVFLCMSERNEISWTSLVQAYAQNGQVQEATEALRRMPLHDAIPLTSVLSSCGAAGRVEEARRLFLSMKHRDAFPWVVLLTAYARSGQPRVSAAVFNRMPAWNSVAWTSMVAAQSRAGRLHEASRLLERMPIADVVAWTSLITALSQCGQCKEALELFKRMDIEGVQADKFAYSAALDVCADLSAAVEGRLVHRDAIESGAADAVVSNSAVTMYGRCGRVDEAVRAFNEMVNRRLEKPTISSWNALIAAHTDNGLDAEALAVFANLLLDGRVQPDSITFTGILSACNQCGKLADARRYLVTMFPDFGLTPVAEQYGVLSCSLARLGKLAEAEDLLVSMPYHPNAAAWLSLLTACSVHYLSLGAAERGERAAEYVWWLEPHCPSPYIVLSNMYAALKRPKDVARIRKLMKDRGVVNNRGLSSVEVKGRLLPFAVPEKLTRNLYKKRRPKSNCDSFRKLQP